MINQKIRYSFIKSFLDIEKKIGGLVCEVGSGNYGLGRFYPSIAFTGVDINFFDYSKEINNFPKNMTPIIADITKRLPIPSDNFSLVISLDTFEHISAYKRETVIKELIRISNKLIIIGIPCGRDAYKADLFHFTLLRFLDRPIPIWLKEHINNQYPKINELDKMLDKLDIKYQIDWNESLTLHKIVQFFEMITFGTSFFDLFLSIKLLSGLSKIGHKFYRKFYIIRKS